MLAIIGGSGLLKLDFLENNFPVSIQTDFQDTPVQLIRGCHGNQDLLFLPRHGEAHSIAPHLVNYRANISALKQAGAQRIIAVNAIGGIDPRLEPGAIAVPDQLIDYTYCRHSTFSDGLDTAINHVDFTHPYDAELRQTLITSAQSVNGALAQPKILVVDGVYGCTQGPRLETAAEINKLRQDGCTMVGMTGMPEAVLARELDLTYACIALSVNWGAGISAEEISMEEIYAVLAPGMEFITKILAKTVSVQA